VNHDLNFARHFRDNRESALGTLRPGLRTHWTRGAERSGNTCSNNPPAAIDQHNAASPGLAQSIASFAWRAGANRATAAKHGSDRRMQA
jgi:hypothetical protein